MRVVRDGLKLVATLLVVAVFAVIIDRSADIYAESRTASAFGLAFETSADVSIEGYPFLTQWRNGEYEDVQVDITRFDVSGTTVKDVRLDLTDVRMKPYASGPEDMVKAKADKVRMAGTVPYDEMKLPFGIKAKHKRGTDDQVRLTGSVPVTVLGKRLNVPFAADVRVKIEKGKIRLQPRSVQVLGGLSTKVVDKLVRKHLDRSIAPPGLPKSLRAKELTAQEDGLRAVATGTDVKLPKQ
ncbi:MAG: DUF2993 domain-containing protein [Streptosporangiales bacterium]|nr:DUF2993 domain-containing protein [Streptosporangiales bacterium]